MDDAEADSGTKKCDAKTTRCTEKKHTKYVNSINLETVDINNDIQKALEENDC